MTLQEVEDLARHVGGEALHHAVRHAHPFAVRARQADESACRRQRRERAQHLGLLAAHHVRSEEHTSELQSLMRISYAVFCLKKKTPGLSTNSDRCSSTRPNATAN